MSFNPQTTQEVVDKLNKIARSVLGNQSRKNKHSVLLWRTQRFAFGYTPWSDSKGSFYAIKYKTSGDILAPVHKVRFASRKVASKRAYKWYQKQKEREQHYKPRPPKPEPKKPTGQDKLSRVQERIKKLQRKLKGLNTRLKKAKLREKYYIKKTAEESYKKLEGPKQ